MMETLRCKNCGADRTVGVCQLCGCDQFVDVSRFYDQDVLQHYQAQRKAAEV